MKYLRGMAKLPLILSADGTGILKWWVDGAYTVHLNMRGQSGGGFSFGRGFHVVSSTKHKINTRSSTETEVVSVDDFMPAIMWTRYFLQAQGYDVNDNVVFQDNMSSILLEKNGKASSSKRTKHINIRYFFITDRVKAGEVTVEWCPTGKMIADFATKLLQGAMFRRFRDMLLGVVPPVLPSQSIHDIADKENQPPLKGTRRSTSQNATPQECVGVKPSGDTKRHSRGDTAGDTRKPRTQKRIQKLVTHKDPKKIFASQPPIQPKAHF